MSLLPIIFIHCPLYLYRWIHKYFEYLLSRAYDKGFYDF
jgi:hypothetical protein